MAFVSWSPVPTGNVQGICPVGWHLPTDAEWTAFTDYVSSQTEYLCNSNADNIAKALASTTNWLTSANTCAVGNTPAANNATGFSGLPGGYRPNNSAYRYLGGDGFWWSSTENSASVALSRYLDSSVAGVYRDNYTKDSGFSVRCLRD